METIIENKYIFPILTLIVSIYFVQARPKLPTYIEKIFENMIFRFVVIAYIIYRGNDDPAMAIMISVGFLFVMHYLNRMKLNY